jgi:hypothetical protein
MPFLVKTDACGQNQFAYLHQRGYRDALAFVTLSWIWAVGLGKRVAVYCSDVAGAFDRVSAERLIFKLRSKGVHEKLLTLLGSWLAERMARVCVEGCFSEGFALYNMVFQGTVLGPLLWNVYYADSSHAVRKHDFTEAIFADDLNCWRLFAGGAGDSRITAETQKCQSSLHAWGEANQVVFEATKESLHIVDARHPIGDNFKILSVIYDPRLNMFDAVHHFCSEAGWRLKSLLRTTRYYNNADLVRLFKCNVLSFIEGATPAIYHAAPSILTPLDDLFESFLTHIGISFECALAEFNLAPLSMRRDIAMLGMLHKVSLDAAPNSLCRLFRRRPQNLLNYCASDRPRHARQLHDPVEFNHPVIIKRSAYGLIRVYNALPGHVLSAKTAKSFQRKLQKLAKEAASANAADWQLMFHASR